jgi:hypothetical protein
VPELVGDVGDDLLAVARDRAAGIAHIGDVGQFGMFHAVGLLLQLLQPHVERAEGFGEFQLLGLGQRLVAEDEHRIFVHGGIDGFDRSASSGLARGRRRRLRRRNACGSA